MQRFSSVSPAHGRARTSSRSFVKLEPVPVPFAGQPASQAAPRRHHEFTALRTLSESGSVETLERAVRDSESILQTLLQVLFQANNDEFIVRMIGTLEKLLQANTSHPFTIGIAGGTGQGKSSIINALLGEKDLIPTSSVRACTAVAIEILKKLLENSPDRYIAKVNFITLEEWRAQLILLFADINSDSSEVNNSSTPAGIAWAKIRAVHPDITRETLSNYSVESLLAYPPVRELLDTNKIIKASEANEFRKAILPYVGGKASTVEVHELNPQGSGSGRASSQRRQVRITLWPLIRKVQIRTNAEILKTGLVLVDLPGVADFNAARDSVSAEYLKKCDAIWVVSKISRAIDDKTGQNLLGESFKQQIKLDGNYGNISLICSQTDQIDFSEAYEEFGLDRQLGAYDEVRTNLQEWKSRNDQRQDDLRRRAETLLQNFDKEINERISECDMMLSTAAGHEQARPPFHNRRKRAATDFATRPAKRALPQSRAMSEAQNMPGESTENENFATAADIRERLENVPLMPLNPEHLTIDMIQSQMGELEVVLGATRAAKFEVDREALELGQEQKRLEKEVDLKRRRLMACGVKARNNYVRKEAQKQFARDMDNLDNHGSGYEGPTQYFGEVNQGHSTSGARLPVFCVSSKAYTIIHGIGQDAGSVDGFEHEKHTEIPQLAQYAIELTRKGRIWRARRFLTNVLELQTSLQIWSSDESWQARLTQAEDRRHQLALQHAVSEMKTSFDILLMEFMDTCGLATHMIKRDMTDCIIASSRKALDISSQWHKGNGNSKGLPWQSYKAVCRYEGEFHAKLRNCDFNEELVFPLKQSLQSAWTQAFTATIPKALETVSEGAQVLQAHFLEEMRPVLNSQMSRSQVTRLELDCRTRARSLSLTTDTFKHSLTSLQRDSNRRITPGVKSEMLAIYGVIEQMSATGVYNAAQNKMHSFVATRAEKMFTDATDSVQRDLARLVGELHGNIERSMADMMDNMETNYTNAMGLQATSAGLGDMQAAQAARNEIVSALDLVDGRYTSILENSMQPPLQRLFLVDSDDEEEN